MCYTTRVEFLAALGPQAGVVGGSEARGVLLTLWGQFNDMSRSEDKHKHLEAAEKYDLLELKQMCEGALEST